MIDLSREQLSSWAAVTLHSSRPFLTLPVVTKGGQGMQQQSASCQQAFGQLCDRLASGACTKNRSFLQKTVLLETLEGNPRPSCSW